MGKIVWAVFKCIFKVAYYAACTLWLIFPLYLTAIIVPDTTRFLKDLGQELPWRTLALMKYSLICGIICTIINIGFPIWHFFIKRHKTSIFQNNIFFWWVSITNVVLIFWLLAAIFGPIYSGGGGKMGT